LEQKAGTQNKLAIANKPDVNYQNSL